MSIQSEIDRINGNVQNTLSTIADTGVSVGTNSDALPSAAAALANEKAPVNHTQAANTITAGTFAGQVVANRAGQTLGTSLLRNAKLVAAEETPTVNGEIFWQYG